MDVTVLDPETPVEGSFQPWPLGQIARQYGREAEQLEARALELEQEAALARASASALRAASVAMRGTNGAHANGIGNGKVKAKAKATAKAPKAKTAKRPRGSNRDAILKFLATAPGAGARQVSEATGIGVAPAATALSQLKRKGHLVAGEAGGYRLP